MSIKKAKSKSAKRVGIGSRQQDYEQGFQLLYHAITEIFNKNIKNLSYELIYRTTYNLTRHQHGEQLYEDIKELIGDYLDKVAKTRIVPEFAMTVGTTGSSSSSLQVVDGADADGDASFLKTVKLVWDDYTAAMKMIRFGLYYLDDKLPSYDLPHVFDMGLDVFRDKIVRSEKYPIQDHLITTMLNQIQRQRHGDTIDCGAIQVSIAMLLELLNPNSRITVYATDFETKYLETSATFYQMESQALTNSNYDAPEFMRKVERRLEEEEERTTHYLSMMTEPKIRLIVETQLIANNLKTIIEMPNSGLDNMLNADKYEDLSRMYKLFSLVPAGLNEMNSGIRAYILQKGRDINQQVHADLSTPTRNATKPKSATETAAVPGGSRPAIRWMEQVLDLQAKIHRILVASTNNDKTFQTSFNEAFQQFINENSRSAEFISLFIDENLKKRLKNKTEDEVDELLDKTISLFRLLCDKDVFERYYKNHLAKRLLLNRSILDDAERGMLGRLKRECGYQFTIKLEGMFNDMRLSAEINSQFKTYRTQSTNKKEEVETTVTVLTSTFWPINISTQHTCILPTKVTNACTSFEQFYFVRHNGRLLTWQHQLGTADIKAQFKSSKLILNVSIYGMVVLLLFNHIATGDSISLEEIQQQTNISKTELKRTLQSLTCAKYKILLKNGNGPDMNQPGERFKVNDKFTSNLARIKVQALTTATTNRIESNAEQKHTRNKVDEERQYQIEAAIVRIMKNRKVMEHNALISETVKQLSSRFMPDPVLTKTRIEALIDRDYLERATDNRWNYRYLA